MLIFKKIVLSFLLFLFIQNSFSAQAPCDSLTNSFLSGDVGRTDYPGLKYYGNQKWISDAGLIYGKGSVDGNRLNHVLQHTIKKTDGRYHTVFKATPDELPMLIDEAWLKRGPSLADDPAAFVVDMGRVIGTRGERGVKIVIVAGTKKIVTVYPLHLR